MAFAATKIFSQLLERTTRGFMKGQWYRERYQYTQLVSDTGGTLTTLPTAAAGMRNASATLGANGATEEVAINQTTGVVTITSPGGTDSATIGWVDIIYLRI